MSLITSGERSLYRTSLTENSRLDGRQNHESREVFLDSNNLCHSDSSSCLSVQHESCHLTSSVKLSLQEHSKHSPPVFFTLSLLDSQGLSSHSSLHHSLNTYLTTVLDKVSQQLIIIPNQKHWHLLIDLYLIGQSLHPSLLQPMALTLLTSLVGLNIPEIKAQVNQLTDALELELIQPVSSYPLNRCHLLSTVVLEIGEIGGQYVIDLDSKEYLSCDAVYSCTVSVDVEENKNCLKQMQLARGSCNQSLSLVYLPPLAIKQAMLLLQYVQEYISNQ